MVRFVLICMTLCVVAEAHASVVKTADQKLVDRIVREYGCAAESASWEFGATVAPSFIIGVIAAESSGNPRAVSRADARGLMQVKVVALKEVRRYYPDRWFDDDLFDPKNNIRVGVAYFSYILNGYDRGISYGDTYEASLGYNRGPTGGLDWGLERAWDDGYARQVHYFARLTPPLVCND